MRSIAVFIVRRCLTYKTFGYVCVSGGGYAIVLRFLAEMGAGKGILDGASVDPAPELVLVGASIV